MRRGPKPKGKTRIKWSAKFAYAIGLLTADGCLSKDGRHIDFTSKDRAQVLLFKRCLGLKNKISRKRSGAGNLSYHTQFGDVLFYQFLIGIGLVPAKSKVLSSLAIPKRYFLDFVRGLFDGDGCSYSFYDSAFKNSYRFYISFASASPHFLNWLQGELGRALGVTGYVSRGKRMSHIQLKYSKYDALKIIAGMYYRRKIPCLKRKYLKICKTMRIIKQRRGGEIGRHATFRS